jgi:hypothetical protein
MRFKKVSALYLAEIIQNSGVTGNFEPPQKINKIFLCFWKVLIGGSFQINQPMFALFYKIKRKSLYVRRK